MKNNRLTQGLRTWQRLAIPLATATLVACGGGGSATALSGASTLLTGTAVDGYLQGATVFLDANSNGVFDATEPTAKTDANGRYALDTSGITQPIGLPVVVTGGVDTDTGYAFTGRLTARVGQATGQVVTPLTSLVDTLVAQGLAKDTSAAQAMVAAALGLSVADLATDPVAAVVNQPAIYNTAVTLQRSVQLLASANANAGESSHQAQERVLKAFAVAIKSQSSAVNVSQLIAALTLPNKTGAQQLATAVHDGVNTALANGGHASAKAVLMGLDQVRVRMDNDHDFDLDKAADKLDNERGLSTSRPFKNLVQSGATSTEVTAMTNLFKPGKVVAQPSNTTGRLLASNCFQCHGTGGMGGFESIKGDAAEVKKYLTKTANSDIMAAHAQGYTNAQLDAIIAYLQQ